MLHRSDDSPFTTGKIPYSDQSPLAKQNSENRIWVVVQFAELLSGLAIVDTGSPWCVLSREEAESQDSNYKSGALDKITMRIRGHSLPGVLVRWPVTLFAEKGENLTIDSTIFIPDEDVDGLPNFLGLDGFLNRINFAVDSYNRFFFFGAQAI